MDWPPFNINVIEYECPNCKAVKVITHQIRLSDMTILEIKYQCGGKIRLDLPWSSWLWLNVCNLRIMN